MGHPCFSSPSSRARRDPCPPPLPGRHGLTPPGDTVRVSASNITDFSGWAQGVEAYFSGHMEMLRYPPKQHVGRSCSQPRERKMSQTWGTSRGDERRPPPAGTGSSGCRRALAFSPPTHTRSPRASCFPPRLAPRGAAGGKCPGRGRQAQAALGGSWASALGPSRARDAGMPDAFLRVRRGRWHLGWDVRAGGGQPNGGGG